MGTRAAGRRRFLPWTYNCSSSGCPGALSEPPPSKVLQSLRFLSLTLSKSAETLSCLLGPRTNWTLEPQGLGGAQKSPQRMINLWITLDTNLRMSWIAFKRFCYTWTKYLRNIQCFLFSQNVSVQSMVQDQRMPQGKHHSNQLLPTLNLCKMVPSITWHQT